jgi:hypothetical protein
MTGHTTYDATCPRCQTNWITRRWGCFRVDQGTLGALGPGAWVDNPVCPTCGAMDATSHPDGCEFWNGTATLGGYRTFRFDDLEPYIAAYEAPRNVGPSRPLIFSTAGLGAAVVILPTLPYGTVAALALLAAVAVVGGAALVDRIILRHRRLP